MNLQYYFIFVLLVSVPVVQIFRRAGFRPYWALLLWVPYVGLSLCAGALALMKWRKA